MGELSGKVAVITGSTRGIGLATAQLFTEEGAKVVMNGRRRDALDAALGSVPGSVGVEGNVTDRAVSESMVSTALERFGRLDVAVANAVTLGRPTSITDLDDDQWARSIGANLSGVFYLVRAAGRVMVEQGGGSIIIVGSLAGQRGLGAATPYSASKGGLIGLVGAAAKDLGPSGVRVNLVQPSAATRATLANWSLEHLDNMTLLKRHGEPREVAQALCFLASDRSSFITGENLNVDGGTNLVFGE